LDNLTRRLLGMALILLAPVTAFAETIEKPGPSTLIVRLTSSAKMIGFPAVCPGTTPEEMNPDDICMAELYEARVRVLRNLGGTQTPRDLTIRFTAHSFHIVWQKGVRFLLVVSPFEDKGAKGHFAQYWDWEDENGQFCKDLSSHEKGDWEPIKRAYALGKTRIVKKANKNWNEGAQIICINGREEERI
jgi:hypothetical protein